MKSHENQSQTRIFKIYLPRDKQWVEVTEAQYYAYYRDIWATRKRAQAHHRCMCPKSKHWMCDGDCLGCEFHAAGDTLSMDRTYKNSDGDELSMLDKLADSAAGIEDVVADQILLDMLFRRLAEIMPEAKTIGLLRQDGMSDEAIAKLIGIPRTTFLSRLKKAKELLQREFPDLF